MTTAVARTRSGEGTAVAMIGVMTGVALVPAFALVGPSAALVPIGLGVCWFLLWNPVVTLGLLFAATVLFEQSTGVWPLSLDRWYGTIGPTPLHPPDLLVLLLLGWVAIDRPNRREPGPGLGRFALPVALLAIATVGGIVTGYVGGGRGTDVYGPARVLSYLIAVPYVTATVLIRRADVRRPVVFAVALVTVRAIVGLVGWAVHGSGAAADAGLTGVSASVSAGAGSFYEPTMNFLMVVLLLGVVTALVVRHRLPRWLLLASPFVAAALVASFRRSFWIAAVLGLVLVLLVATGQRGRPWLVMGGAAVALALYLALSAGGATDSSNPVLYRAQSLAPSRLAATSGDRYRLEEQRNVLAEIRAHPLTGLGLGVAWTARYPLSEEHIGGRLYTHVTPLWFWLKLGPFGLIAYAWMMVTAVREAFRVWRRGDDTTVRVAGLALAAGLVGLVVAELTGPFSGIDVRITLIVAFAFGWLTAARSSSTPPGRSEAVGRSGGAPIGRLMTR